MKPFFIGCIALLFTASSAWPEEPTAAVPAPSPAPQAAQEEFDIRARLDALVADEQAAVDTLRQYDRMQLLLIEWDQERAESHAADGEKELAQSCIVSLKGRIQTVREGYEHLIERFPNNARLQNNYGEWMYDQVGDQAKAIVAWRMAAGLDGEYGAPQNNLAIHYCHVGDYAMGFRYLERALKLDPKNPDYLFNGAQIYLVHGPQVAEYHEWNKKKVYREAMKMSKLAAELQPNDYTLRQDYAVNFNAAVNFDVEVNWREAAEAWRAARGAARTETEIFYTWLNEGRAWIAANKRAQAEKCLTQSLAIYPDSDVVQRLLDRLRAEE